MTADGRDTRLRESLEALKRLGVDPESAPVEALDRALSEDPATAFAVADRLGAIASAESGRLLARLEASSGDKLLRREARRSIYRLRQKGVEPAPAAKPAGTMPARPLLGGAEPEGFLSISDSRGDRLLWIVKARAAGGVWHLSTVVNEPAGLREAVLAEVSRKSVRSLREEVARRHHLRMVEADWRYCDWIAAEGYERARASGELAASAAPYSQLRLQLFTTPATATDPPLARGANEKSLAESAALLEQEELRGWALGEDVMAGPLARYREIRDSPIVLDRSAQLGRIEEIVQGATDEVFSGDRATSWRRRLAEASLVFAATGRAAAAAAAAAAADALATRGTGRGIPFCEAFVRGVFGAFFAREAEREMEEKSGSVLVTPDDLRAEQARRQRTPRGR